MKTTARTFAMIILLGAGSWFFPAEAKAYVGITYRVFYNELLPYGTWINNPVYGNVWVPNAGPGFTPYATNGYWEYTVYGWTWVSYYPWGWAPFHYGRWYYDSWYGWMWIPGTEWGPGWVAWRQCNGYYGWAPLAPGFTFAVYVPIPVFQWVFVPVRHFGHHNMHNYYMGRRDNDWLYNHSTYLRNTSVDRETRTRYYSGPDVGEVRKATGRDIKPMEIQAVDKPSQRTTGSKMEIYRPRVQETSMREKTTPIPERNTRQNEFTRSTENTVRPVQPAERQKQATPAPAVRQERTRPEFYSHPVEKQRQPAPAQRNVSEKPKTLNPATPSQRKNTAPARTAEPRQSDNKMKRK